MRSIIIVILTAIIAISYVNDTSVRGIIDGGVNFVNSAFDNPPSINEASETVKETVDGES